VLDFIDMKSRRDQQSVYQKIKEGLRRDKAKTHVLRFAARPYGNDPATAFRKCARRRV